MECYQHLIHFWRSQTIIFVEKQIKTALNCNIKINVSTSYWLLVIVNVCYHVIEISSNVSQYSPIHCLWNRLKGASFVFVFHPSSGIWPSSFLFETLFLELAGICIHSCFSDTFYCRESRGITFDCRQAFKHVWEPIKKLK